MDFFCPLSQNLSFYFLLAELAMELEPLLDARQRDLPLSHTPTPIQTM